MNESALLPLNAFHLRSSHSVITASLFCITLCLFEHRVSVITMLTPTTFKISTLNIKESLPENTKNMYTAYYVDIYYYHCFYYYCCSTALCWALARILISWSHTKSVGLLGRGISLSQGHYLHAGQHRHRLNAQNTDIHALNRIATHDPNVRSSKNSLCLISRGHCDRHVRLLLVFFILKIINS
jgi:hypothetical protein